jgi:hypothetical protein
MTARDIGRRDPGAINRGAGYAPSPMPNRNGQQVFRGGSQSGPEGHQAPETPASPPLRSPSLGGVATKLRVGQ